MPRTVTISATRLIPWVDGFRARHGEVTVRHGDEALILAGQDGSGAVIVVPFPPLAPDAEPVAALQRHLAVPRRVGALLVRKGGFAVGVFDGATLIASKVGSAYVQGKTKAGGWSQQRYARRRDNQTIKAYEEAADAAAKILLPYARSLAAVATGGDKPAIAAVLADPRLSELEPLVLPEVHPVPDPRLRVLQALPERFLSVRIELNDLA